jgi:hypothetical protein
MHRWLALERITGRSQRIGAEELLEVYHLWGGLSDRGGRENPSRKVRTPKGEGGG